MSGSATRQDLTRPPAPPGARAATSGLSSVWMQTPATEDGDQSGARTDARVIRTRRRLRVALVALTLERGYEAVSIRELTDVAGVGYATFFRHSRDKAELLLDLLNELLAELMTLLEPTLGAGDTSRE